MSHADTSSKAALDRFLADNPELEELSARLSTFNAFRALKIEKAEIRHSNVLAWLLDPNESHGLGDIVLRRVLSNMFLESDTDVAGLSAAQVELMDFADVEVKREWRHIDLLVVDRRNEVVVLIENKILSGEKPGALVRYLEVVSEEFPSYKIVPVFLTLTGQAASDDAPDEYIPYSYSRLLVILKGLLGQRRSQLAEPVEMFLTQYIDTLRRLTMEDKGLVNLCKKIYRRHRQAIDLITEYGMATKSQEVIESVLEEEGYELLRSAPKFIMFMPESWAKLIPENGTAWSGMKRPVSAASWFQLGEGRLRIAFEVSGMTDPQLRLACVEALRDAGFRLTSKAFDEDAKFSRFFSVVQRVEDMTDEEAVRDAAKKLLHKAKAQLPKVEEVFREVFGNVSR